MFRGRGRIGMGALPRKLAGIILAVVGLALIVNKVPVIIWWFVLGTGLIFLGWKLYTC